MGRAECSVPSVLSAHIFDKFPANNNNKRIHETHGSVRTVLPLLCYIYIYASPVFRSRPIVFAKQRANVKCENNSPANRNNWNNAGVVKLYLHTASWRIKKKEKKKKRREMGNASQCPFWERKRERRMGEVKMWNFTKFKSYPSVRKTEDKFFWEEILERLERLFLDRWKIKEGMKLKWSISLRRKSKE